MTAILCLLAFSAEAQDDKTPSDTLAQEQPASTGITLPHLSEIKDITHDPQLNPLQKMKGYGKFLVKIIDAFDNIDSNYVSRIDYNFTAMLQSTTDFEFYTVGNNDYSRRLSFAQRPNFRLGPYFGWRWLFLGYTFDLTTLGKSKIQRGSKFEFSIYTAMFGIDVISRHTGGDFYLRKVEGLGPQAEEYEGSDINDYINTRVRGFNLYYTFNHKRFSNPAVFSQSTIQRHSAGSWQAGFSITSHDIRFNYNSLPQQFFAETEEENHLSALERVKFVDYSLMGGYAFNWVFKRNWCLGTAFTPSVGYKRMSTKTVVFSNEETEADDEDISAFRRKLNDIFSRRGNIGIDLTGRLGIIYNNGRWFVSLFGVVHNFNYHRSPLRFHNTFGNANLCGGFYFQKKKKKENTKKAPIPGNN